MRLLAGEGGPSRKLSSLEADEPVTTLVVTLGLDGPSGRAETTWLREADARTRTGDPFITSEVLYQLSYVGPTDVG
jgi:hypothetical protein